MKGLSDQASANASKADSLYGKMEGIADNLTGYADEAYDEIKGGMDQYNTYLDELKNNYKDIIPETIQQARDGVLDENADYGGEMNRAESEVGVAYDNANSALQRDLDRSGQNASSGRNVSSRRGALMEQFQARGTARTSARLNERDRIDRNKSVNYNARSALTTQGQGLIAGASNRISQMAESASNAKLQKSNLEGLRLSTYGALSNEYKGAAASTGEALAAYSEGNKAGYRENVGGLTYNYKPTGIYSGA